MPLTFLRGRLRSISFALRGIIELLRSQHNARIHLLAVVVVSAFGWHFGLQRWEWALLLLTFGGVLAGEAFNTALEYLTDLVSPGYQPLAGKVKDLAAAAVLIWAIIAVGIGLLILGPYLVSSFDF